LQLRLPCVEQPRELGTLAAFLCHEDALGITMEDIQLNAAALW
jgi:hypothetical protein